MKNDSNEACDYHTSNFIVNSELKNVLNIIQLTLVNYNKLSIQPQDTT